MIAQSGLSCHCIASWALMHHVLFSLCSCTRLVAYHLGTLDVQCADVKHVMMESNHKRALVNVSRRCKDWQECMLEPEILSSWSNWRPGPRSEGPKALLVLTLTQCYPGQAPEHNPYFQYSMLLFKYCALSFLGVEWNPSMHVSP